VSLVGKALRDFLARNEIRTLLREVEREVRSSDLLPFGTADGVVARIRSLLVQPEIAGVLKMWLESYEDEVKDPLEKRFGQLLDFEHQGIDSQQLAVLVVGSIEKNLARAKRTDREAMMLEAGRTRRQIDELKDQLADVGSVGPAEPPTARSLRIAAAIVELPPSQGDIVQKLVAVDPDGAVSIQEALSAGGAERIANAIDGNASWLEEGSAEVWEAAGRLAESIGRLPQAQRAYECAAEHPGVADGARQLVRASHAAEIQGDPERGSELLEAARAADPQNPAVLLREARQTTDPDKTLERLDAIVPTDDDQAASIEIARVEALIHKREFERARESLARVRNLQADQRGSDELEAGLVISEAQVGLPDDLGIPPGPLVDAGQTLLKLASEMREQERWDGVAILTGRAILAFALADSSREASRLLDEALADEQLLKTVEARRLFATGALLLHRPDDVLALVPASGDETDRLDRVAAHVMSGDPERCAGAVPELTELMNAGGTESSRAAYLLLCASTNNPEVPWDPSAEVTVASEQPWTATMLKAFRLAAVGDFDGAEAHVRPHSDNPTALRYLVHLASRREEHDKALRLSESLVERTGAASDRLQHAAILARNGEQDKAIDRLLALARDPAASSDDRGTAFSRAGNLLQEAERFPELEALGLEWAAFDGANDNPRWIAILAMAMRFRHSDALAKWRDFGEPEAHSLPRARLLGEVFTLAAKPRDALEMLVKLSDRFERPEEMEAAIISGSIRLESTSQDLPDDLAQRIRETFETFPERFPDSTAFTAIAVDLENPASSLLAAFGPQLEERAQRSDEAASQVRAGTTAVALLASAAGRSIGETLFLLPALPLAFPTDQFDRDGADAVVAYEAGAAVWDATAIFVVGALGGDIEHTVRSVLPSSGVVRATVHDVARDLVASGDGERGEISVVDGALAFGTWSESDREANIRRATEMQRLATELSVLPLAAAGHDDDALLQIADRDDAPTSIRSWAGTLAVARREGLAVFSDDRVVRQSARELGLKAFSTMSLLDVLVDRGVVKPEVRDDVRHRLLRNGALGLAPSAEQLAELAREADWQPTPGLRAALGDLSSWMALRTRYAERVLRFLDIVAQQAPEHMDRWVHRAIDAVTHDVGGDYLGHANLFLLVAISPIEDPPRMSDTGLRALIDSVRRMRYFEVFRPARDLLVDAVASLLATTEDERLRALMFRRVSDRLGSEDQRLLRDHFVR
jgi:tetratricopeptide (TPR) repeat protein